VVNLFESQADRSPGAVALVCDGQQMSYAELEAASNRLARYFISQGIRAEDVVAVMLEPSLQAIVSILGVLKAGAGYLPLDPSSPSGRLEYMLWDSGAKFVVATQSHYEELDCL